MLKNGGAFILRIDDTDPTCQPVRTLRYSARHEVAFSLVLIGTRAQTWAAGDCGPYSQTERLDLYREAATKLLAEWAKYTLASASPEKLVEDKKAAEERHDPFQAYQRACRNIDPAEAQRRIDAGEPSPSASRAFLGPRRCYNHDATMT